MERASLPDSFVNGTLFDYDITDAVYKSQDYDLELVLFTKSQKVEATVTDNSDGGWNVKILPVDTEDMIAGAWGFQVFVSDGVEFRKHILSGVMEVTQDATKTVSPSKDSRSHARIVLDNIDALMENGDFLKTLDPSQIESLESVRRNYYFEAKREQEAEALRLGKGPAKNLRVRFAK